MLWEKLLQPKTKAQVVRREARMVTFRDKRLVFDDSLNDFLLKLEEAEVIVGDSCIGKHSNWSLSEQLQSLEVSSKPYIYIYDD